MKTRRTFLAIIIVLLAVATTALADRLLIVPKIDSGRKPYVLDTVTGEKTTPFDGAYYEGETGPTPNPPGPNPPTPPSPTSDVTARAKAITSSTIKSAEAAQVLAATVDFFAKQVTAGNIPASDVAKGLDPALSLAGKTIGAEADFAAWLKAIESQFGTTFTGVMLGQIRDGVLAAFNLSADAIDAAYSSAVDGKSVPARLAKGKKGIDIISLITLIQQIIQLLQKIFPGFLGG